MSKTPRTDAAAQDSIVCVYETSRQLESELYNKRKAHDVTRAMLRAKRAEWAKAKRGLSDALATLRDVQSYLECGARLCDCLGDHINACNRCRLLDDVKTTIANCKQ